MVQLKVWLTYFSTVIIITNEMNGLLQAENAAQKRRIVEQEALISQLEARIVILEARVSELTALLLQNSRNSSRPPSSDAPWVKRKSPKKESGRKAGGQRGHAGHSREPVPPEEVDETIDVHTVRFVGQSLRTKRSLKTRMRIRLRICRKARPE